MTAECYPDRSREFLLVRSVRNFATQAQRDVSENTRNDYLVKYARMQRTGMLPEDIARTKRSYYAYRSALLYCSRELAREALRARDRAQHGSVGWQTAMAQLNQLQATFMRYPPDSHKQHHMTGSSSFTWRDIKRYRGQLGTSPHVHSKKRVLSDLRRIDSWREKVFEQITARHRDAVAVIALTGARPSEIARGATIRCEHNKHGESLLVITIVGTKVTSTTGQPERTLRVRMQSPLAHYLRARLSDENGAYITVSTHPANLCAATIKAGRKAFPKLKETITPYVFRHAFASDLKAASADPVLLAQALGHRATETQQYYGYAVCASGRSPLEAVRASAPVRTTHRQPCLKIAMSHRQPPAPSSPVVF